MTDGKRLAFLVINLVNSKPNDNHTGDEGLIKGTKFIAVIKKMCSRDNDQTWKTDTTQQRT